MAEARKVLELVARTASGSSDPVVLVSDPGETLALLANVTAVGGVGPSLALSVEWSHDGSDFAPADPADTLGAAIIAATKRVRTYTIKGPYYRVVWTISGTTPLFTFAMSEHTTT